MADGKTETNEAWVDLPRVGDLPAMARLIAAHGRIGPAFSALYSQIMLAPEGKLARPEREMVAGVAASAQDCFY